MRLGNKSEAKGRVVTTNLSQILKPSCPHRFTNDDERDRDEDEKDSSVHELDQPPDRQTFWRMRLQEQRRMFWMGKIEIMKVSDIK